MIFFFLCEFYKKKKIVDECGWRRHLNIPKTINLKHKNSFCTKLLYKIVYKGQIRCVADNTEFQNTSTKI